VERFRIYDTSISIEHIAQERAERYQKYSSLQKLNELCQLIRLSVELNGGAPLKMPQAKGILIRKK
jgi:hypothetical protein